MCNYDGLMAMLVYSWYYCFAIVVAFVVDCCYRCHYHFQRKLYVFDDCCFDVYFYRYIVVVCVVAVAIVLLQHVLV